MKSPGALTALLLFSFAPVPAAAPTQKADPRSARFDARDLNHDGKLSLEELITTVDHKENAKARSEQLDLDKDGFITREEFLKQGKK